MPTIINRSEETWEFGVLRVPPGESAYSTEDVERAMATTQMAQHMTDVTDLRAPHAKFVLDMSGPEARSLELTATVSAAKETLKHQCRCGAALSDGAVKCSECATGKIGVGAYQAKLQEHTRSELRQMATDLDVAEAGKMNKATLIKVLVDRAQ